MSAEDSTAAALCACGCGEQPTLAPFSHAARGWVRGEPIRYVHGHNTRKAVRYIAEDRGFETPCWIWQLHINSDGHGRWTLNGKIGMAHRMMYEQRHGPVPAHMDIHHKCGVRACVNPEHLEPLTVLEHRHEHSRLTWGVVAEIRRQREAGAPLDVLSERFGVSKGHLSDIVNGKAWVS